MGFFLDLKERNRKTLKALEPTKEEHPNLVAESELFFFTHYAKKNPRKHCSASVNLIRSMAIKGYIHT